MAFSIGVMLESFDRRFDLETLEEFQRHFESSVAGRKKSLQSEYGGLTADQFEDPEDLPNYQSHLEDEFFSLDEVQKLGYELCIVALYKQVELHTKQVVKRNFPSVDEKALFNFAQKLGYELCIVALYKQVELHTKQVVKRNFPSVDEKALFNFAKLKAALPFKIGKLKNYAAVNELRLINNAIKHEGRVSKELAKYYPIWKAGEKLDGLEFALNRLSPLLQKYVEEFVTAAYQHSVKYKKPVTP